MTSGVENELLTLQNLVESKEQEWRSLSQEHSRTLEKALAEKTKQCNLEKTRFRKLKEDFEYNLSLIADRDEELKKYDVLLTDYKKKETTWIAEVSEAKIICDEMKIYCEQLVKEKQELQRHYTMRVNNMQLEAECFYKKKEDELHTERQEYEELKRKIQLQLRDREDDLATQRQQMLHEFDTEMTKKDHLHSKLIDEKDTQIHAHLLQIKTLNREIELRDQNLASSSENTDQVHHENVKLKKALKEKDWEFQDVQNMMNLKIKDMEKKMEISLKEFKRKEEEHIRKFNNENRLCLEKEQAITKMKTEYEAQEENQTNNIKTLQTSLEQKDVELRRVQWGIADLEKEHEVRIKVLQERVDELELQLRRDKELHAQHTVTRDVELEALRQAHSTYQEELKRREEDVNRYKKDLSSALHREKILEKAKVQLELDWKHKYEKVESDQYQKQEDLITNMSKAKDEALENFKENKRVLVEQEKLLKALQLDRASLISILRQNNVPLPALTVGNDVDDDSADAQAIIEQNIQLKDVVAQMRSEMEMLNQQLEVQQPTPDINNRRMGVADDYTRDLEDEVKQLKSANRELQSKLDDTVNNLRHKPPPHSVSVTGNETAIINHFKELNSTIGALRNEKVQLTAKLQSQNSKLSFLQNQVSTLESKLQQKALSTEQMMYEMSSKNQYEADDKNSLLQRIAELEMLLNAARSEIDVYCKSNMENNLKLTTLGNQFSSLKVQSVGKEGTSKFVAPAVEHKSNQEERIVSDSTLKKKLGLAIERIKILTNEKEQLIHMGNKLRAEISSLKGKFPLQSTNPSNDTSTQAPSQLKDFSTSVNSRLKKLEQMQYTTKNQKFVQSKPEPNQIQVDLNPLESSGSIDNTSFISTRTPQVPLTSSSEHSSIQEIWKLLEQSNVSLDTSNRYEHPMMHQGVIDEEPVQDISIVDTDEAVVKTDRTPVDTDKAGNSGMAITGTTIAASTRIPVKSATSKVAVKRPTIKQKKAQIRNYNIRDNI